MPAKTLGMSAICLALLAAPAAAQVQRHIDGYPVHESNIDLLAERLLERPMAWACRSPASPGSSRATTP